MRVRFGLLRVLALPLPRVVCCCWPCTSRAKSSDMKATSQPSAPRSQRASCSLGSLYASNAKPAASTAFVWLNGAPAIKVSACCMVREGAPTARREAANACGRAERLAAGAHAAAAGSSTTPTSIGSRDPCFDTRQCSTRQDRSASWCKIARRPWCNGGLAKLHGEWGGIPRTTCLEIYMSKPGHRVRRS